MKQHIRIPLFVCFVAVAAPAWPAQPSADTAKGAPDPVSVETIRSAAVEAEKLWKENPNAYFQMTREDAKRFRQAGGDSQEFDALLEAFNNMINKPVPLPAEDNNAYRLLQRQCWSIREYIQNPHLRKDERVLKAVSRYIGNMRSQIIPAYVCPIRPFDKPLLQPPSEKRDRQQREYERKKSETNYQQALNKENRSLSYSLSRNLQSFRKHSHKEEKRGYVEEMMELARFAHNEKADVMERLGWEIPESVSAEAIRDSVAEAEKFWPENPRTYFWVTAQNAKCFNKEGDSPPEYSALFGSFTNMVNKPTPLPEANKNAYDLLAHQCLSIEEHIRNPYLRKDERVWEAVAAHIGNMRSQIIPDYVSPLGPYKKVYPRNPSSEEVAKKKSKYERQKAKDDYQQVLNEKNLTLSDSLNNYLKNLLHHSQEEEKRGHVQELMELARFTDEEKASMMQ